MSAATAPENLRQLQTSFAAHLRDPQRQPAPADVEELRMQIYRDLFFNNICNFLGGNFPVLKAIYGDQQWRSLARDFFREHRAHTPLFPELPKEFLRYLQEQRLDREGDPPFLLELAHYEWVELALSLDPAELDEVTADTEGDLLQQPPVLSPLAWMLSYRFAVHEIRPDNQPAEPPAEATHLLVYRNRNDQVRFMHVKPAVRLLLERLQQHPQESGQQLILGLARQLNHPNPQELMEFGSRLLSDLRQRDIILGTRPTTD